MSPRQVNFMVLSIACGVAVVLGEALARVVLPPPPEIIDVTPATGSESPPPLRLDLERRPGGGRRSLYVFTPTGRRLRANTIARIRDHQLGRRDVVIRTNSIGYRNPELGEKRETRVLFLGDSITLGHWLHEEETFVRRVEKLSRSGRQPLETVNAGIGAIGLENELAILSETGLSIRPDVVVLDFYLNDVQASPGVRGTRPPRFLTPFHLARHLWRAGSYLLSQDKDDGRIPGEVLLSWQEEISRRFPPGPGDPLTHPRAFHRLVRDRTIDWGSAWSDGAWRLMEPLFQELRRQADRNGFVPLIVAFPVRYQVEAAFLSDHPQQRLRQVAAGIGVPLLDLLPILREAHRGSSERLFFDQCHHTPHGNEIIAKEVLKFIVRKNPVRSSR